MISALTIQSKLYQLFANIPMPSLDHNAEVYIRTWNQNQARRQTLQIIAKRYPADIDSIFDDYFLCHAGAQTVDRYLAGRLDRHSAARQLAVDWFEQLEGPSSTPTKHLLTDATMAADSLLCYLENESNLR